MSTNQQLSQRAANRIGLEDFDAIAEIIADTYAPELAELVRLLRGGV